jgi:hypothetical protein
MEHTWPVGTTSSNGAIEEFHTATSRADDALRNETSALRSRKRSAQTTAPFGSTFQKGLIEIGKLANSFIYATFKTSELRDIGSSKFSEKTFRVSNESQQKGPLRYPIPRRTSTHERRGLDERNHGQHR